MALIKGSKPNKTDDVSHERPLPTDTGTRPSKLRFEHRRHMYFDGKKWLPSVTGIVGKAEDKSGLLGWYADTTATCAIEEAAELSRIRRLESDDAAFEWLRKAPDRERDKATVSGSDLHDVADRMLSSMDMPDDLHPDIELMAKNVLAFMADYRVEVLHSEVRLANRTLGYGGTTDQVGIVPQYGELPLIIDWKTSASMYRSPKFSHGKNAMQLAPYAQAEVMFWDDKTESDMIKVNTEVGLIVMIRPEGYKVYDYDLVRAWPQFERAFASYHWWRDVDELCHGPIRPAGVTTSVTTPNEAEMIDEITALRNKLFDAIRAARDEDVLAALWEDHQDHWIEDHTLLVQARLAELETKKIPVPQSAIDALKEPCPQGVKLKVITALRAAASEGELTELWEANAETWDEDCTRMAKARIRELTS